MEPRFIRCIHGIWHQRSADISAWL